MSLKIERCADFPFVLGIRNGSSELMGSRNGISQPILAAGLPGSGDRLHKSPQTATAGLSRSGKPEEQGLLEVTASSQPRNGKSAWT